MSVSERDNSILKHIIDYCDQINMAVERFGDDFEIFDKDKIAQGSGTRDVVKTQAESDNLDPVLKMKMIESLRKQMIGNIPICLNRYKNKDWHYFYGDQYIDYSNEKTVQFKFWYNFGGIGFFSRSVNETYFNTAPWRWDLAEFVYDLDTGNRYVVLSTYAGIGEEYREDIVLLSANELNRIIKGIASNEKCKVPEELKYLETEEDWDNLADESFKTAMLEAKQLFIIEEQKNEQEENAVKIPDDYFNKFPSMKINKIILDLIGKWRFSCVIN